MTASAKPLLVKRKKILARAAEAAAAYVPAPCRPRPGPLTAADMNAWLRSLPRITPEDLR